MSGIYTFSTTDNKLGSDSETINGDLMMSSAYLGLAYDFSGRAGMRLGVRADRFNGNADAFGLDETSRAILSP